MPYLYYPDATEALTFLASAFGFDVASEVRDQDGAVWNAKVRCGDTRTCILPDCGGHQWIFAQD
jgi:uncharacterized glyoxalase superfamily protein PhnB